MSRIPIPKQLDTSCNLALNWKRFQRDWKNYEIASKLNAESAEVRLATLLAIIGSDALEIYDGLFVSDGEDRTVEEVLAAFNAFCVGKTNETYERFVFNSRIQKEGESIDSYLAELRKLAKTCNYAQLEDSLIRDRVVIGVTNEEIRRKLLENYDLTLQKAVDTVRSMEIAVRQVQLCATGSSTTNVDRLRTKCEETSIDQLRVRRGKQSHVRYEKQMCTRCGNFHNDEGCLAKDAKCHKCEKMGHYEKMCRTKINANKFHYRNNPRQRKYVNNLVDEFDSDSDDGNFIGTVSNKKDAPVENPWRADISIENSIVNFKLDTGADVTVIPETVVPLNVKVDSTKKRLFGPGREEVKVKGKFTTELKRGKIKTRQKIYVVKDLTEPLLGRPAIEALKLFTRVNKIEEDQYESDIKRQYPELFTGLGTIKGRQYTINLHDDASPVSVSTPRRIPLAYYEKVRQELKRLEEMDIIRSISKPTEWCAPIVVVPKNNNKVRICVDLTKLNQCVKRENFPMPCTDQLLSQLTGQKIWSKLDCNAGFHQLLLSEESQELTTFITPFGRYCYKRLCFGISSGPEIFQREMCHLLKDIPGVICAIDDILVGGATQEEHDARLHMVLCRLKEAGLTLNEKCRFSQSKIKFLGHIISNAGIEIDPDKKKAISEFPDPTNVKELRRFLGMLNHVSKFLENVAEKTEPLRELLKSENEWIWEQTQKKAFETLKSDLLKPPVLVHYNAKRQTKVSTDASQHGLGAVLFQKIDGHWKPVFYASRSLTPTEQRYPQVEKEALGVTWGCERFSDYLVGLQNFQIETDHKPLLALLQTKRLDELTPRIQRFRMRLMRYSFTIQYTKGKYLHTADALSRAPVKSESDENECLGEKEVDLYVNFVMNNLPASKGRQEEIRNAQNNDMIIGEVKGYCFTGWPSSRNSNAEMKKYYSVRSQLTVHNDILLYQSRIVIPKAMQKEIMRKLHESHLGIVKCRALANESVWWPGISADIENEVRNCGICEKYKIVPPEPLKPSVTPLHPWQKIGIDLFEWKGLTYLLLVDYYSRWIEIAYLKSATSSSVTEHMKSVFAKYGIPQTVI